MNFKINNEKSKINNRDLLKAVESEPSTENKTEKENIASNIKQIGFCSTAAVLGSLGIFVSSKGKKNPKPVEKVLKHINPQDLVDSAENFINNFIKGKDKDIEKVFLTHDFSLYNKHGIPLKYPRKEFIKDIKNVIDGLPHSRRNEVLKQFNLIRTPDDIDGIANLAGKIDNTAESLAVKGFIENFYYKNEANISDPKAQKALDCLIKGFPEFNMTIGKVQHETHSFPVDIHSLKVLQKSLNHPSYAGLSDEGKAVLKLTTLIHDFGKSGKIKSPGHALLSTRQAEGFIDNYNLPENIKARVLKHVEYHHWFEKYNQEIINAEDVKNIFKTPEDLEIAKILAKGDFESVNRTFHLDKLNELKTLTKDEYEKEFAAKMNKISFS